VLQERVAAVCQIAIAAAEGRCLWCVAVCCRVCCSVLQERVAAVCQIAIAAAGSRCLWCVAVCVAARDAVCGSMCL